VPQQEPVHAVHVSFILRISILKMSFNVLHSSIVWRGGVVVRTSDLHSSPSRSASRNDSGPLVPAIGWEGNRRSGIALAMRHRLNGISTYWLNCLGKGDEHIA